MKNWKRYIVSLLTVCTLALLPAGVYAQEVEEVPDTTTPTATVPDTGIAPASSQFAKTLTVFAGGSAIGAVVGLGVLSARRRQLQK